MFDTDQPAKKWENRSLLSLGGEENTSVSGEHSIPRAQVQPDPAVRSPVQELGSAQKNEAEPVAEAREPGRVRLFLRRARNGFSLIQPESEMHSAEPAKRQPSAEQERPIETEMQREWPSAYDAHDEAERSRPEHPASPPQGSEGVYWEPIIDPVRVFSGIWRARRLIIATTILGAIAGVFFALATPKKYYSATEILFDPRDLQIVDRELTGGNLPSDATLALIENQVAIIKSSVVLNKVVERLKLAEDPEFNGEGGSLLSMLNPRALFSFGGEGSQEGRQVTLAVENLAEKLNVERNERTFVIHIGALTENAEKSARIANTTAEVFIEQTGEMQQQTAVRANTAITNRLDELQAAVESAEKAVADFKAQHDIIDADGRLITDDEIVRLNDQLSTARARTAELQARVDSARNLDVDQVVGGALPEQVSSPVITDLLAQYASLSQQADRAATRYGPRHPANQAVQAELAGVREAIARELRRVTASMQVELQRAVQLEQDLAGRLARLKVEKGDLEAERVQLRELERDAATRRAVYESFLLRARQTGQQRSLNTANVSVISTAYPPLLPMGPSRATIAIAGTVLGFLAGIGIGGAMGAVESLRENMASRSSVPTGTPSGGSSRPYGRREDDSGEDGDDFDPPPGRGPGGRRFARSEPLQGRTEGTRPGWSADRSTTGIQPEREHAITAFRPIARAPLTAPASHSGAKSTRHSGPYASAVVHAPPVWPALASSPAQGVAGPDLRDEEPDLVQIDRIRQRLRAFRRGIDELSQRRSRRAG